jgi:pyocin large subunit-like protein
MGFKSASAYQKAAGKVIANKKAIHKKTSDKDILYFLESTDEFVVVSKWGFIRTYFIPDAGRYYYDKQK